MTKSSEKEKKSKKNIKKKPEGYIFGRPTDYQEHYPELLLQRMGRDGLSATRFSAELEVSKETFYQWVKKYPDFSDSFQRAKNMCEAFWEKEVLNLWTAEKVNTPLVKLYMANRFGWTVKIDSNVTATISHEDYLKELS